MSKVTVTLALALTIMAQTALARESRSDRAPNPSTASKSTQGHRSKGATTVKGSPTTAESECKKYLPIIGRVVDVPCSR